MSDADTSPDASHDLSLMGGGPSHQALARLRLRSVECPLLGRQIGFLVGLTWLPPLALAALAGNATGNRVAVPFLEDFGAAARLLLALPLLVVGEPLCPCQVATGHP